jgi:hypothetical protein
VIGAELGREDHGSISATVGGGWNHLMLELTPGPD